MKERRKRTPEVRRSISLSCSLISKLRKLSSYRSWTKDDFVVCQSKHDGIDVPSKRDHITRYQLLCRFAIRSGISNVCPEDIQKPVKQKNKKIRNTRYDGTNGFTAWRKVRYEALVRSGGQCECCGATVKSSGEPLHVDHIKPKSIHPELELKLSNLQVLCADCNGGKGNWDETDWRSINTEREAAEALDAEHLAKVTRIY